MGRIVAIANQKGGVGKTTTAVNLGAALSQLGQRILLFDLDPQANASSGLGVFPGGPQKTSYDVLVGDVSIEAAQSPTGIDGLSVVPSTPALAGVEVELNGIPDRERILESRLRESAAAFDYVLIDCPPSLGVLTVNALVAADSILIPIQCEYFALEGVGHLLETVTLVRERLNPRLEIEGVLLTMFDGRLNLSIQVAEEARRHFGERVYTTMIPRNVRLGEAPSFGKPICTYDPSCIGAISYSRLAKEILGHD
jgi:chromosome partitioning protein